MIPDWLYPFIPWMVIIVSFAALYRFFMWYHGEPTKSSATAQAGRVQPITESRHAPEPPKVEAPPAPVVATPAMKTISIQALAAADNVLIVGNRGSGKTTLLAALLHYRLPAQYIFDPHNEPEKWQKAARVIGGGRAFQDVYSALQAAERTMDDRSKELAVDKTAKERFVPFSVISDEWGSVVEEIEYDKAKDPAPGKLVRLLLKEGRKFKISFIASAHGDTNASLGCAGDKEAFQNSFDWFIYMGAFVAQRVTPDVMKNIPLGKNPEGGTFPLVVVAYSPTTRETRLLDLRGITSDEATPATAPTPMDLEKRLDMIGRYSELEITDEEIEEMRRPKPSQAEQDARKLQAFIDGVIDETGERPSHTAMRMHLCGYTNDTAKKRVEQALLLLEKRGLTPATTA